MPTYKSLQTITTKSETTLTQHRVIGISLRPGRIERIEVWRIQYRAGFPPCDQVRVGEERPPPGDQGAFARRQIALGARGIVAAGKDQRALECAAERRLDRLGHRRRAPRRMID